MRDRSFAVRLDDSVCDRRPSSSGVQQGSVVGPLLYLLYTSDLRSAIPRGVDYRTYADDTKVFSDVSVDDNYRSLQSALDGIHEWACRWQLQISASKSAVLHVLNRSDRTYSKAGVPIPAVDSIRDL